MTRNLTALACGALFAILAAAPVANAQTIVARMGSQDPPTTAKHRGLVKAAALIKERTNGEVDIQVFPSSQLGGGRQMVEGAQIGTIDTAIVPAAFIGGFNPLVSVFDIPYILPTDREKSRKLRDGPVGQSVLDSFRQARPRAGHAVGRRPQAVHFEQVARSDIAAFSGQRFRVMDSKILISSSARSAHPPIVLQFGELYTALQNGVIDAPGESARHHPGDEVLRGAEEPSGDRSRCHHRGHPAEPEVLQAPHAGERRRSSRRPSRRSRRRSRPERRRTPASRSSSSSEGPQGARSPTRPSARSCARRSIRRRAPRISRPGRRRAARRSIELYENELRTLK